MFPGTTVIFGLVCGYLAHQLEQFGGGLDPAKEKSTIDTRLKSLIKWAWVEGEAEAVVNGTVDALVAVTQDESDVKALLLDVAGKNWPGASGAVAALIAKNFKPTTDEGKIVLELAQEAVSYLESSLGAPSPLVAVAGPVEHAAVAEPSPLVTDEHVAEKTPA